MISEPELVGGADGDPAPELPLPQEPAPRRRPPPRAWLWGLGGAVAASALWAGGLYAYHATADGGPGTGPYGTVDDLCGKTELKSLTAIYGEVQTREPDTRTHEALDRASCYAFFQAPSDGEGSGEGTALSVSASAVYVLHKKTDPGPEFDGVVATESEMMNSTSEEVADLGERAYLSKGDGHMALQVLDGQAVVRMSLDVYQADPEGSTDAEPLPDVTDSKDLLVADARALLAELRVGDG
ncbi:hypothetical protein ACH41E_12825 [Streptomyces sp. NPDC020412]|uniref:hypothetical protein n=1 Tax=Streptomyces sp. NPDC020412 TaxID=3365073 RepID=UPI003793C72E